MAFKRFLSSCDEEDDEEEERRGNKNGEKTKRKNRGEKKSQNLRELQSKMKKIWKWGLSAFLQTKSRVSRSSWLIFWSSLKIKRKRFKIFGRLDFSKKMKKAEKEMNECSMILAHKYHSIIREILHRKRWRLWKISTASSSQIRLMKKTGPLNAETVSFIIFTTKKIKLDLSLEVFLKKQRRLTSFVQEFARNGFVVKQKLSRDSFKLLFKGWFLSADLSSNFKPFAQNKPTWHITLDTEGHVSKCSKRSSSLPKSHLLPKSTKATGPSFGELVLGKEVARRRGCDSPEQDPQYQPEAVRLLAEWGVSDRVNANFCICLLPICVPVCWIYPRSQLPQSDDLIWGPGSFAWKLSLAPRTDSDSERKLWSIKEAEQKSWFWQGTLRLLWQMKEKTK